MSVATPIWVFDTNCVLCSGAVAYAIRHEKRGSRMRFVAIGSAQGRALAREHGIDPDDPTSFLFLDRGRAFQASDGVLALMRRLRGPAGWLAPLGRFVPRALRDPLYHLVARNRYRLFGRREACMAPAPGERDRFVLDDG